MLNREDQLTIQTESRQHFSKEKKYKVSLTEILGSQHKEVEERATVQQYEKLSVMTQRALTGSQRL